MGTESCASGRIKVDENYPSELDEPPPFDVKKIENIRSNVKFDTLYQVTKLLGDGKFGKVYCVIEKESGQEFAAKFIKIRKEADRAEVEREVSILTQLRHPRIAQIYDAFYTTTNDVVLIMEIVRGGELFDRVAEESYELSEIAVVMIICQLCEAIDYIHKQNILHLDVKPENIMCVSLTGNRIKLIDFGLARHYDGTQELKYMAGTPEFAAPEVIKFERLDYHTDMWSIGVITYILLSGYSPFLGDNLGETYCNVEKGVWEFTEEFDTVSAEAKDFISKLLIYDQRKRMLPHECLQHPWIAKHRQKVASDTILERPINAPQLDNKQIMKYNAKRKFRRMIIYVKFLIEMNRLRNSLKTRMSENGHKFFDPLLKLAEKKEQKISVVCNSSNPTTSGLNTLVQKAIESKRKGSEASHLSHLGKIQEEEQSIDSDNKVKETEKKKRKESKTNEKVEPNVGDNVIKKKTKRSLKEKMKQEENGKEHVVVDLSKRESTTSDKSDLPRQFKTLEFAENGDVVLKKKSSLKKRNIEKGEAQKLSDPSSSTIESSETKKSGEPKKSVDSTASGTHKKIVSSNGNDAEKEKKFKADKSSSVDSTKENNLDAKKPQRQGALRKRDKSIDDVLNSAPTPTRLTKENENEKVVSHTMIQTAKPNGQVVKSEKVLATQRSLKTSKGVNGKEEKLFAQIVDDKESIPKINTTIVSFESPNIKIVKKPSTKIKKIVPEKPLESSTNLTTVEKKMPKMTLTAEKNETTTVQTTTSVKRKTTSSEKKTEHHNSTGRSVESVDKKKSQKDNLKISQVTTKKEETPNTATPQMSINKNVLKHVVSKSTAEKEKKITETKKDDEKLIKKTSSVTGVDTSKLLLANSTKENGEKESKTMVKGSSTAVQKLELKSEELITPKKSSLKKSTNLLDKTVKQLNIEKNKIGLGLKSTELASTTVHPDSSSETSSSKSVRINLNDASFKKSNFKSNASSVSTRDSSEERKKVRFARDMKQPSNTSNLTSSSKLPAFGPGLQKMKSESCIHKKITENDGKKKRRNDLLSTRKTSLFSDLDYQPKDEFSFENLRQQLTRRVSEVYEDFDQKPKKMISIPPTNSVKDRLRHFEKKFAK